MKVANALRSAYQSASYALSMTPEAGGTTIGMVGHKTPALVADGIYKSYGVHEVLKGVSLQAERGDVISLIGSSGSGKSTFLRCMNLLEIPTRGRIAVGQREISVETDATGRVVGIPFIGYAADNRTTSAFNDAIRSYGVDLNVVLESETTPASLKNLVSERCSRNRSPFFRGALSPTGGRPRFGP
ncbi:ABC-type molybdenum transport system ATPase subunit/photorepair protein PhrA [Paraburkholderia sp. Clong3]|uniref:ATP-binding cassette domain-containing protein n=1 Tax=Paraburkholderia sp. Clong3 TaxID=2991061 RepID=UPI003D1A52E3